MIKEIQNITNREMTLSQIGMRIRKTPLYSQIVQKTCLIATQIQIYSQLPLLNKIWTTLRFSNNSDSIYNLLKRFKMMMTQKSIFILIWINRIQINLQLLNNNRCKEIIVGQKRTIFYRRKIDCPSNQ